MDMYGKGVDFVRLQNGSVIKASELVNAERLKGLDISNVLLDVSYGPKPKSQVKINLDKLFTKPYTANVAGLAQTIGIGNVKR